MIDRRGFLGSVLASAAVCLPFRKPPLAEPLDLPITVFINSDLRDGRLAKALRGSRVADDCSFINCVFDGKGMSEVVFKDCFFQGITVYDHRFPLNFEGKNRFLDSVFHDGSASYFV